MVGLSWIASSALQCMCDPCACLGLVEEECEGAGEEEVVGEGMQKVSGQKEEERAEPGQVGTIQKAEDGTLWKVMWVKVQANGEPEMPFQAKASLGKAQGVAFMPPTPKAAPGTPNHLLAPQPKAQPSPSTPLGEQLALPSPGTGYSPLRKSFKAIAKSLKHLAERQNRGAELEESGPKMILTVEAKDWQAPDRLEPGTRLAWPLTPNTEVDFTKFSSYLTSTKGLDAASTSKYCLNMTYFYGLFELPSAFSQEGFLASLFSSGVGEELFALPIMDERLPHTKSLCTALSHYVDFLVMYCTRVNHPEAVRGINLFRSEVLKPRNTKCIKQRKTADNRNRDMDEVKLDNLPPMAMLKAAVHKSMIDLHWLVELAKGITEPMDKTAMIAGNSIVAGLAFLYVCMP